MKPISEGRKMFFSVMALLVMYAVFFLIFEDYDRNVLHPLSETSDWYLLLFSVVVIAIVGILLYRYGRMMDQRISREKAEEQNAMRRQLTQNIAHELKTPVTSIQGYIETLLESPNISTDTAHQFLLRSYAQTQRLTALLQDISTLNRMDFAPQQHDFQTIDLADIIRQVETDTAIALSRQDMLLISDMPDHILMEGDASLLYSIFRNLVDNAVAYAGRSSVINITVSERSGAWFIRFADNGVGVEPQHLPRLFERFYRVDKGRSRQMGGTGLGLAIVKNAVVLHHGIIHAFSNIGEGLAFEFTLGKG